MIKKIYQELVMIRKELQAIQNNLERVTNDPSNAKKVSNALNGFNLRV